VTAQAELPRSVSEGCRRETQPLSEPHELVELIQARFPATVPEPVRDVVQQVAEDAQELRHREA
jgi:hypothetical protein